MKTRLSLGFSIALAFCATSCQQEDSVLEQIANDNATIGKTFTAVMEPLTTTRMAVDIVENKAQYKWTDGDIIDVVSKDQSTEEVKINVANGQATFTYDGSTPNCAFYPNIYASGVNNLKVTLPDVYDNYNGNVNAVMYADMTNINSEGQEQPTVEFKHLTGVLCIHFNSVPAGYNQLIFSMKEQDISGDFNVDKTTPQIKSRTTIVQEDNTYHRTNVTFNFTAAAEAKAMDFYIPMPVGTYGEFAIQLKNSTTGDVFVKMASDTERTIGRGTLTTLTIDEVTANFKEAETETGVKSYQIGTRDQLYEVARLANITTNINITLTADIDLSDATKQFDDNKSNWKALGYSFKVGNNSRNHIYGGIFNGNNKKITGMHIESTSVFQGFIGVLGRTGEVKNLTIEDCYVESSGGNIAAVVGGNVGKVSNCKLTCSGTGKKSEVKYTGTAAIPTIGGIVGWSDTDTQVISCSVTTENGGEIMITNTGANVGAIVGGNGLGNIINDCSVINGTNGEITVSSDKDYVGAIIGRNRGTILGCSVVNNATAEKVMVSAEGYNAGGIAGLNYVDAEDGAASINGCIVKNISISGNYNVGGITGINPDKCTVISCLAENVSLSMPKTPTVATEAGSIGGVVGVNASILTNCYAYNCSVTITGAEEDDSQPAATTNVVGRNIYSSVSGAVSNCYYRISTTEANKVIGVTGTTAEDVAAGATAIDWSNEADSDNNQIGDGALQIMNAAINANSAITDKYLWSGDCNSATVSESN